MKLKKLVICVVALCTAVSAFGLDRKSHLESQKAQKQLAIQMFDRLTRGQDLGALVKSISECKKESYKENRIPAMCISDRKDVIVVKAELISKPGSFKYVKVATVNPEEAFEEAMKMYFTFEKDPEYLDYNKMVEFYNKNIGKWAGNQLKRWASAGDSYVKNVFTLKALLPNERPGDHFRENFFKGVYDQMWKISPMYEWWREGNIFQDPTTFEQVRWEMFKSVALDIKYEPNIRRLFLCKNDFWKHFATEPDSENKRVIKKQIEAIQSAIYKEYNACVQENKKIKNKEWRSDCKTMRKNAIKYGYWPADADDATARMVKAGVSQHLRK